MSALLHGRVDDHVAVARAAATWQTGLTNRGDGLKIGIIDDGVDQRHPYFSPAGYAMPAGYPRGSPPTRRRR